MLLDTNVGLKRSNLEIYPKDTNLGIGVPLGLVDSCFPTTNHHNKVYCPWDELGKTGGVAIGVPFQEGDIGQR